MLAAGVEVTGMPEEVVRKPKPEGWRDRCQRGEGGRKGIEVRVREDMAVQFVKHEGTWRCWGPLVQMESLNVRPLTLAQCKVSAKHRHRRDSGQL